MPRSALNIVAALGLIVGDAAAQGRPDCGARYRLFLVHFHKEKAPNLSAEKVAETHRTALRAYDACNAGDELYAETLFDGLEREIN